MAIPNGIKQVNHDPGIVPESENKQPNGYIHAPLIIRIEIKNLGYGSQGYRATFDRHFAVIGGYKLNYEDLKRVNETNNTFVGYGLHRVFLLVRYRKLLKAIIRVMELANELKGELIHTSLLDAYLTENDFEVATCFASEKINFSSFPTGETVKSHIARVKKRALNAIKRIKQGNEIYPDSSE